MEDIATICDRLIIVNHGEIMWNGQKQDLLDKFSSNKYITLINQKVLLRRILRAK
ncbi:hypothetical protein [uncultured Lactobacillus sp.]|uniref:hypothetical protein n=1 Tax=uncultured Lactobacillus sp. TaxID=153152 RepID=UPI0025E496C4|nr:hypothetical protein [uncultured Lactobacillus sp.]